MAFEVGSQIGLNRDDWGLSVLGAPLEKWPDTMLETASRGCGQRSTEDTRYAQRRRQEGARTGGHGCEGWDTLLGGKGKLHRWLLW